MIHTDCVLCGKRIATSVVKSQNYIYYKVSIVQKCCDRRMSIIEILT